MSLGSIPKDPSAVLDYQFDWSPWLAPSETISSHTITAQSGITVNSSAVSGGSVVVWVAGGTAGRVYALACRITTSASRTDERTMTLQVEDR